MAAQPAESAAAADAAAAAAADAAAAAAAAVALLAARGGNDRLSATVDATVETFDEDAYCQRLATPLGVPLEAVEVTVAPGSVIVVTDVQASEEAAQSIVDGINLVGQPLTTPRPTPARPPEGGGP